MLAFNNDAKTPKAVPWNLGFMIIGIIEYITDENIAIDKPINTTGIKPKYDLSCELEGGIIKYKLCHRDMANDPSIEKLILHPNLSEAIPMRGVKINQIRNTL